MKNFAQANTHEHRPMTEEEFLIAASMLNKEERATFLELAKEMQRKH
jgi:hypothetical protein